MLENTQNTQNITGLILITSESCNLQCSYCDMANHINKEKHKKEAVNVVKSLTDGTYLKTLEQSCTRLNIDFNNITHFELWGQEPTLTLKSFQTMFVGLYDLFPNIESMLFSTNGVGYTQDIIDFIKFSDTIVNKDFKISIQISFDGKKYTKENRGIKPEIILNNIEKLILSLNDLSLNYVKVKIHFHNVIDANIINYFADKKNKKELYNFLLELSDLSEYFISLQDNPSLKVEPFSPGMITPYNASVEEGKNLYNFYKNCQEVGSDLNYPNYFGLTKQFYEKFIYINFHRTLIFLNNLQKNIVDKNYLKQLSVQLGCGSNFGILKVRYDGTLILCQNAIMGLTEDELAHREDPDALIQKRKLSKNFYPNILTDSDEIIDKYLYQMNLFHEESFLSAFSQTLNLMKLLLQANQIDKKYYNTEELILAAYCVTLMTNCPYNGMMQSGALYGKYAGYIRFLCNGFLDIVQEEAQKFLYPKGENNGSN